MPTSSTLPLTVSPQTDLAYILLIFLGMSGLTSQPAMGAVCMALEQTSLGTGIRYQDIQALNTYWSQVRILYGCFEANVRASDSSVFDHEMPGGQYTNLMVRHQILVLMQKDSGLKVPSITVRSRHPMDWSVDSTFPPVITG